MNAETIRDITRLWLQYLWVISGTELAEWADARSPVSDAVCRAVPRTVEVEIISRA